MFQHRVVAEDAVENAIWAVCRFVEGLETSISCAGTAAANHSILSLSTMGTMSAAAALDGGGWVAAHRAAEPKVELRMQQLGRLQPDCAMQFRCRSKLHRELHQAMQ